MSCCVMLKCYSERHSVSVVHIMAVSGKYKGVALSGFHAMTIADVRVAVRQLQVTTGMCLEH